MLTFLTDFRYAMRQLRKSPGFTLTAILTLALGIGANTAIFSLFQQVLLRTMPVRNPQRVVMLRATGATTGYVSTHGDQTYYFNVPMFRDLERRASQFFFHMAASGPFGAPMHIAAGTERVRGELVTGDYFATLGVRPALGRMLQPADDTVRGGNPVVVLSYGEWQKRFAVSPGALNQTVQINAHPFTVVGVAPKDFTGLDRETPTEIFVPMSMEPMVAPHETTWQWQDHHDATWVNIVARLQPGMTRKRAETGLQPLWMALRKNELTFFGKQSPHFAHDFLQTHLFVEKGAQGLPFLQQEDGPMVSVLMGMTALVLLMACVNLANLLLVRGSVRAKETGVRAALGASRTRLLTGVLADGMLLAFVGGGAGILLGIAAMQPLAAGLFGADAKAAPMHSPLGMELLAVATCALLLTGFLSCLPSMVMSTRPDLTRVLHENSGRQSGGAGHLRTLFTALQITLSFVLLVGASLLARTLYNLRHVDVGMRTDHVVQFSTDARSIGIKPEQAAPLMEQIAEALRREPGVSVVAYSKNAVLTGWESGSNITIAGYKAKDDEDMSPDRNSVSPDFFTAMGIPLLAGRMVTADDGAGAPKVALVSESFAMHYFGGVQQALGQMFCFGAGDKHVPDRRIVGVVRDFREIDLKRKITPTLYLPFAQDPQVPQDASFLLRTALPPRAVFSGIRHAVQGVNSGLPVDDLETMDEQLSEDVAEPQLLAVLAIGFGVLAALLAGIGLYGVLAYSVAQRTREIGIRMALGSNRVGVIRLIVSQVAWVVLAALALGVPLSMLLARALRAELFQVTYNDPWMLLAAGVLSFTAALIAAYIPARRAASVDPMQALRSE